MERLCPGETTPHRVWASRRDQDLEKIIATEGVRGTGQRNYRIRWRSDVASTPTVYLSLADGSLDVHGNLIAWSVQNMTEVTQQRRGAVDLRRRFLDLEAVFGE